MERWEEKLERWEEKLVKTALRGGLLLLWEDGAWRVKPGDVLIAEDRIQCVGEIPLEGQWDREVCCRDKLVIPGLINSHTHSYMSVLRGVADDVPFHQWLFQGVMPREESMTWEDAYWSALLGCCEMLMTGTTCFVDMHMFPEAVAKAVADSGIRGVLGRGLAGDDDEGGHRRLAEAFREMELYGDHPRLGFQMSAHAVYSCGAWLLQRAVREAEERGLRLHIHVSESRREVEDCRKDHGCTPVAYLDRLGVFSVPVMAAHCVHITEEDMDILAKRSVTVVHNPISNLKLANGVAPIPRLLERGVRVTLGTDGCASNNALNLFREMGVCALLHKGVSEDAQAVTAHQTLSFVTKEAGEALGLWPIGEIRTGAKGDLTVLDLRQPCFMPGGSAVSSLCYSANGSGVDTVLVDGRIVVEKGVPTLVDMERLGWEISKAAARLDLM